jgi:hypothetical protein
VTCARPRCGDYGFVPVGVLDSVSSNKSSIPEATLRHFLAAVLLLLAPLAAQATIDCNRATRDPLMRVGLPGTPFIALSSADGCWIFVSLSEAAAGSGPGVAVLSRGDGAVSVARTVPLRGVPGGMTLTHDGKVLVVPSGSNVGFLDVHELTMGGAHAVMAYWGDDADGEPERIYATVTSDDHYLFVSNESEGTISVLDLAAARRSHFRIDPLIGTIAVGPGPVGLALSADGRYLYATIQATPQSFGWPLTCRPETDATAAPDHTEGALVVIDATRAVSDPEHAVTKWVKAGCNPVRVVTSPQHQVYVTARGSNALLVFAEAELTAPGEGGEPVVGVLQAHGFLREMRSTADGRTLLVTNLSAGTLEILDLTRSPWTFSPGPSPAVLLADARPAGHFCSCTPPRDSPVPPMVAGGETTPRCFN